MPSSLYLDTARLGQMSLGAQHALSEFHSLAGDIGCCMYFEGFLREGFPRLRDGFPLLNTWSGIAGLKERLKRFASAATDSRVLLASSGNQKLRSSFSRCS